MEVNTLNKTLSVIYADTYDDSWGSTIEVFGIADNEEDVEKICNSVKKEGYYAQIETVTLNEYCRRYLGGYYEQIQKTMIKREEYIEVYLLVRVAKQSMLMLMVHIRL